MEEVWLMQRPDGRIVLKLQRGEGKGRRAVFLHLDPEPATHLANRLKSFAASQKTEPELILKTEGANQ
jgi:hypothetical protein